MEKVRGGREGERWKVKRRRTNKGEKEKKRIEVEEKQGRGCGNRGGGGGSVTVVCCLCPVQQLILHCYSILSDSFCYYRHILLNCVCV
jgi:hypothetical protein